MTSALCELRSEAGGEILFRNAQLRVVLVDDAGFPGFCRVIWHAHAREMTDLTATERTVMMNAVWQVEEAQREVLQPAKINLASLGNVVPHLHWHVIPRYVDDAQFPAPIWAAVARQTLTEVLLARRNLLPALRASIVSRMTGAR